MRIVLPAALVLGIAAAFPDSSRGEVVYWNVFNFEGESAENSAIVTYATLADMLADANRTGVFTPDSGSAGANIVGSGASILSQPPSVPEPSSIILCATGAVGLIGYGRRRRRNGRSRKPEAEETSR